MWEHLIKASDDDMEKSKDITIPTHIKPTLHRQDVGASDKISDGESRVGGYTSTPTHTKPTMTRLNVGASDKSKDLVANMVATDFANDELTSNRSHKVSIDSLIQDIKQFNQPRHSTLPKTTTELLKGLDKGSVSDGFNMLGGLMINLMPLWVLFIVALFYSSVWSMFFVVLACRIVTILVITAIGATSSG